MGRSRRKGKTFFVRECKAFLQQQRELNNKEPPIQKTILYDEHIVFAPVK
jgi:hypothetical protein